MVGASKRGMRYVYILRSINRPRQLYIGHTGNLGLRLCYHNSGRCSHTSKFMPWKIIYIEQFDEAAEAVKRERQIKGWTRAKKEALIAGDNSTLKRLSKRKI